MFEPGQLILPGGCLQAAAGKKAGHRFGNFEGWWGTIEFDVTAAATN